EVIRVYERSRSAPAAGCRQEACRPPVPTGNLHEAQERAERAASEEGAQEPAEHAPARRRGPPGVADDDREGAEGDRAACQLEPGVPGIERERMPGAGRGQQTGIEGRGVRRKGAHPAWWKRYGAREAEGEESGQRAHGGSPRPPVLLARAQRQGEEHEHGRHGKGERPRWMAAAQEREAREQALDPEEDAAPSHACTSAAAGALWPEVG